MKEIIICRVIEICTTARRVLNYEKLPMLHYFWLKSYQMLRNVWYNFWNYTVSAVYLIYEGNNYLPCCRNLHNCQKSTKLWKVTNFWLESYQMLRNVWYNFWNYAVSAVYLINEGNNYLSRYRNLHNCKKTIKLWKVTNVT